jgi:hypothetical protein
MKPTLIHHPLKRIHFNYHSEAALSEFEKAFIDRYKQLHDELAAIKQQLMQQQPEIKKVSDELSLVAVSLQKLQTRVNNIERMLGLGKSDAFVDVMYVFKPGDLQNLVDDFQSIRSEYWNIMTSMHQQFHVIYERFIGFDDKVELFEQEYSRPLLHNFQSMEIDARCFDKDMNEFRAEWSAVAHLQEECLEEYSDWGKNHAAMVSDWDVLFERIKILYRHISSIKNFTAGNTGHEFGLN